MPRLRELKLEFRIYEMITCIGDRFGTWKRHNSVNFSFGSLCVEIWSRFQLPRLLGAKRPTS